jgi:APA family basic amino acid/polyamine antiporter
MITKKNNVASTSSEIVEGRTPQGVSRKLGESWIMYKIRCMFATRQIESMLDSMNNNQLKRTLNGWHLTSLGIGTVIGTGIYVLPGVMAYKYTGPAVVLSFILAAISAVFCALSYAELASMIPAAGSSYTYLYATMGELVAWIVGWVMILEFLIGSASISVGWSGYLMQLVGIIRKQPGYSSPWAKSPIEWDEGSLSFVIKDGYFNFPAAAVAILCTILLIIGTKESSNFTAVVVVIKVLVIIVFIFGTIDHVNPANWSPFIPENPDGVYAHYGVAGVFKGASIAFGAFAGFEVIANTSQECINPQKHLPISLISTLLVCTILYVSVCLVMTGAVPYKKLNVSYPVSLAIEATGRTWLQVLIIVGAVFGMTTAIIGCLYSQSRIFYSMSRDGLIPKLFSKIHPKTRTPYLNSMVLGVIVVVAAGILPIDILAEISGISTLINFTFVNFTVTLLRFKRPELERGFKIPFGSILSTIGGVISFALIVTSAPQSILRVFIWVLAGILVYFVYGLHRSKLNHPEMYPDEDSKNIDILD